MNRAQKFLRAVCVVEIVASIVNFIFWGAIMILDAQSWDTVLDLTAEYSVSTTYLTVSFIIYTVMLLAEIYLGFTGFHAAKHTEEIGKLFVVGLVFLIFLCVEIAIELMRGSLPEVETLIDLLLVSLILYSTNNVRKTLDEELI